MTISKSILESHCINKDCFAYNVKRSHNCAALTEAPDPCPFYKTREQHLKDIKNARKKYLRRSGFNV